MSRPTEQRFGLTMASADSDEPGLIREHDGTVWLVNPDGTRTQLPGAGGGLQTATATVTTDADSFIVAHDFDLAGLALAQYVFTVTALDGDGETFGDGVGEIGVGFSTAVQVSLDGVIWASSTELLFPTGLSQISSSGFAVALDQYEIGCSITPRHLRVGVGLYDSDGNFYAGPNHPTATVRLDVTYLSGAGGSQSLVDLGTVSLVDLLDGPQTMYEPSSPVCVFVTDAVADRVAMANQELQVFQDEALVGDPRRLMRAFATHVNGPQTAGTIPYVSDQPVVAALVTANSGYLVDEALDAWEANHAYADKTCVIGPDDHIWSNSPGTSGPTIPDFAGNEGGTVADNDIVWTDEGPLPTQGSLHLYAQVLPV